MVKPVHNDSLAVQNSQEQKESSVSSTHSHHDCDLTLNPIDPSAKDLSQLKISQAMGPRKWGTEQQEEIRLTRANNGSLDYIRNAPHSKALLAMGHSGKDVANWQDILQKALDHDPEFKEQALSAGILKSADQKIADGKFGDQTRRLTSLAQLRYRAVEAGGATGQVGRETLTTVEQAVELLKHDCVVGDTKPAAKPETTLAPESAPEPETAPVTDPAPAPAPAPVAAASIGQGNQPEPELEVEVETSTGNIDKSQFGKHAVAGFKDKFMEDLKALATPVGLAAAGVVVGGVALAAGTAAAPFVAAGLGAMAVGYGGWGIYKAIRGFNKAEDAKTQAEFNQAARETGEGSVDIAGAIPIGGTAYLTLKARSYFSAAKGLVGRLSSRLPGRNSSTTTPSGTPPTAGATNPTATPNPAGSPAAGATNPPATPNPGGSPTATATNPTATPNPVGNSATANGLSTTVIQGQNTFSGLNFPGSTARGLNQTDNGFEVTINGKSQNVDFSFNQANQSSAQDPLYDFILKGITDISDPIDRQVAANKKFAEYINGKSIEELDRTRDVIRNTKAKPLTKAGGNPAPKPKPNPAKEPEAAANSSKASDPKENLASGPVNPGKKVTSPEPSKDTDSTKSSAAKDSEIATFVPTDPKEKEVWDFMLSTKPEGIHPADHQSSSFKIWKSMDSTKKTEIVTAHEQFSKLPEPDKTAITFALKIGAVPNVPELLGKPQAWLNLANGMRSHYHLDIAILKAGKKGPPEFNTPSDMLLVSSADNHPFQDKYELAMALLKLQADISKLNIHEKDSFGSYKPALDKANQLIESFSRKHMDLNKALRRIAMLGHTDRQVGSDLNHGAENDLKVLQSAFDDLQKFDKFWTTVKPEL